MKIAIFDFDGTLFPKQTIPFLMSYYAKGGYPKGSYIRFCVKLLGTMAKYKNPMVKNYGKEEFRREAASDFVKIFNGMPKEKLEEFFEEVSHAVIKELNQSVVQEVQRCRHEGYHCVLLSGCYEMLLKYVAHAIGIETIIGTTIDESMYKNGTICINALDIAMGPKKVERLQKIFGQEDVDWAASTSFGDSAYDKNILELVGNPVAVRPDEQLREVAVQGNWRILE